MRLPVLLNTLLILLNCVFDVFTVSICSLTVLQLELTSGSGFGASAGLLQGSLLSISKLSFRSLSVPFWLFIFSPTCYCVFLVRFCFKNRAILWVFVELVFPGAWGLPIPPLGVRSCLFVFPPHYLQFLSSPLSQRPPSLPTKHSISCLKSKK